MSSTFTVLPNINQETIECDLRAFTHWLNDLVDQVNYITKIYTDLKEQVDQNTIDIHNLDGRVTNLETRMGNVENRLTNVEGDVNTLRQDVTNLGNTINAINGRVDTLYNWLPVPYGTIDGRGWKFAMGNINVMSTTDAPTAVTVPGIYTSGSVENNDINFK